MTVTMAVAVKMFQNNSLICGFKYSLIHSHGQVHGNQHGYESEHGHMGQKQETGLICHQIYSSRATLRGTHLYIIHT